VIPRPLPRACSRLLSRGATRCRAAIAWSALALAVLGMPRMGWAQANLSGQGLGYPPGQLSARSLGAAGAIAEMDPLSQVNPAAISLVGATTLFFQIEPEFRRVTSGAATDRTTTARYPLFTAAIPVGAQWVFGVSSATLLDRTWTTSTRSDVVLGGETVGSTFKYGSDGSINDLRVAAAWTPVSWAHVGLGGHLVSGSDRVFVGRTFDSPAFGGFADTSVIGFDGGAVSAGVELVAPRLATFAASFRKGAKLNATRSDTALGSGRVPDRFGASLAYIGVAGTQIAARTSLDKWSSLANLRRGSVHAVDAWDSSVGADIAGPRFGSQSIMLRTGVRWRTLPYKAAGNKVRERSLSGGLGALFAGGRVLTDVTLTRAQRDAGLPVNEKAWTLSIGLGVRP